MWSASSRGPTHGGRKKPDIVAVAATQHANRGWNPGPVWAASEGTSLANPQVAGAAALLHGSGITDSMAQKAILINSAYQTAGQTGWQADWGWGALDLQQALIERNPTHWHTAAVGGEKVRLYRTMPGAEHDRTTLVWNRRVTGCIGAGCVENIVMGLTNLNLSAWDPETGAVVSTCTAAGPSVEPCAGSRIDNTEQLRMPGGQVGRDTIVKVKAASSVDGLAAEPYAIASRRAITPLVTPEPTTSVTLSASAVRPGEDVQVQAVVRNPSPDLIAENVAVGLDLPAGVQLIAGSQSQSPVGGELNTGAEFTVNWTIRGTSDGTRQIVARTQASRYGEGFETSGSQALIVDSTPPAPAIAVPPGAVANPALGIGWGATDAGSGVASYEVEAAVDGGPFAPWLSATAAGGATYQGAPGHAYRFRARARDRLGNLSGYAHSPEVLVVSQAGNGVGGQGEGTVVVKRHAGLRIVRARLTADKLSVLGALRREASGRVLIGYVPRAAKPKARASGKARSVKPVRTAARVRRGRFAATIRLPRRARKAQRGRLTVAYKGDRRHRPARRFLNVRRTERKRR